MTNSKRLIEVSDKHNQMIDKIKKGKGKSKKFIVAELLEFAIKNMEE